MRAVRWHGRGDVRLDEVPAPERVEAGFAIVEVTLCGICGSDLSELRDGPKLIRPNPHPLTGKAPPVTLGHELVGRILVAADGERWPAGLRVTVDACLRCGRCDACATGAYQRCRLGGSIGLHSDGAFAPRVVVPEYCLVSVPDGVADTYAALTEPLAVGLHAVDRGHVRSGDAVLVLGFGPIGAASALLARTRGGQVRVVELEPGRRSRAEELGFATIEPDEDLPRRVRRAFGGGGAEVVVETTGSGGVAETAVECARRGGRIVLAGLAGVSSTLDTTRLVLFERALIGSLGYRHDLPRVLALMDAGLLDPGGLIGGIVPLVEAIPTMEALARAPDSRIKVLVAANG